jgi:uncharacterized membrane protein
MSTQTFVFLSVRALHVLLAAFWVGTVAFVYLLLLPALDEVGPSGAALMTAMGRRGIHALMASVGGITVLTGLWLYWRFTGGFDPTVSATVGARVFGAGGVAGILALIIGGAVVGRTAKKLQGLGAKLGGTTDATERTALLADMGAMKRRMAVAGKIVLALQAVALICMAVGHYV